VGFKILKRLVIKPADGGRLGGPLLGNSLLKMEWQIGILNILAGEENGKALDLGFVGEVNEVNLEPLRDCIRRSVTPVISPTARGEDGKVYNCNADIAAAKTAIALKARRLVFMSDVPGLLRDPQDDSSLMSHLRVIDVPQMRKTGVIGEGMIPKVDSAMAAIESGVEKVQFVDGRIPHSVLLEIFTDAGVGTEVVLE